MPSFLRSKTFISKVNRIRLTRLRLLISSTTLENVTRFALSEPALTWRVLSNLLRMFSAEGPDVSSSYKFCSVGGCNDYI